MWGMAPYRRRCIKKNVSYAHVFSFCFWMETVDSERTGQFKSPLWPEDTVEYRIYTHKAVNSTELEQLASECNNFARRKCAGHVWYYAPFYVRPPPAVGYGMNFILWILFEGLFPAQCCAATFFGVGHMIFLITHSTSYFWEYIIVRLVPS